MSDGLTKSARRVFDILELFRERQCPLRLKDVVDSLGMPTSSAAALLKTMAQMNYLSFESTSRTYLPTLRLSQLGSWVTVGNGANLRDGADPGSRPQDWTQGWGDDPAGDGHRHLCRDRRYPASETTAAILHDRRLQGPAGAFRCGVAAARRRVRRRHRADLPAHGENEKDRARGIVAQPAQGRHRSRAQRWLLPVPRHGDQGRRRGRHGDADPARSPAAGDRG